ncbi:JAB domain-containing protein [Marinomonas agarivorans]|nr:JAB domain-containing protein [Marinomonas agarivorans]
MGINNWPKHQRPREKLIKQGADALSDAELLAIFLRTGVAGVNAIELAQRVLLHFGSIKGLMGADQKAFCACLGLGEAKFAQLQAVFEMSKRYLSESLSIEDVFTNVEMVQTFLSVKLRHSHREVFAVLFLDTQHRLLHYQELFYGTIDSSPVYPREIIKAALKHNASACILAHNHPSGMTTPSESDIYITKKVQDALNLMDIRLLDHFIVGNGAPLSMAKHGYL